MRHVEFCIKMLSKVSCVRFKSRGMKGRIACNRATAEQQSLIGKQIASYLIRKRQDYHTSLISRLSHIAHHHTLHHRSRVRLTVRIMM